MSPTDKPSALVQGTLDMLILKTLALEPMHGYGIGVRIEQMSNGAFRVNAGSLFPAFRRLERDGLIEGEWQTTEHNRRAKLVLAHRRRPQTAEGSGPRLAGANQRDCRHPRRAPERRVMTIAPAPVVRSPRARPPPPRRRRPGRRAARLPGRGD